MAETQHEDVGSGASNMAIKRSLKSKLVRTELAILAAVSLMTLSAVMWLSVRTQQGHLDAIEQRIEASIQSKGRVLIKNQSLALRGMVDDNAYGAVKDLVARTIREDSDVTVGLFLGEAGRPWAFFSPENPPPSPDAKGEALAAATSEGWKELNIDQASVPGDRVVLIGHSLGALTALMATGQAPQRQALCGRLP